MSWVRGLIWFPEHLDAANRLREFSLDGIQFWLAYSVRWDGVEYVCPTLVFDGTPSRNTTPEALHDLICMYADVPPKKAHSDISTDQQNIPQVVKSTGAGGNYYSIRIHPINSGIELAAEELALDEQIKQVVIRRVSQGNEQVPCIDLMSSRDPREAILRADVVMTKYRMSGVRYDYVRDLEALTEPVRT